MNRIKPLVGSLAKARVAIFGDLILDHYTFGKVDRISPEAPVPIVRVQRESFMAGGSANVALNIRSFGGRVRVFGVVGNDAFGGEVTGFLDRHGIDTTGVVVEDDRPTTLKTRIIAHHQHIVRVDREDVRPIGRRTMRSVLDRIEHGLDGCNVIILSDYAKGFITKELVEAVRRYARAHDALVLADPKVKNIGLFKGLDLVTPNRKEALEAAGVTDTDGSADLVKVGRSLVSSLKLKNLLITRSEEGMSLFSKGRHIHLPTLAQDVFDVSGAGDTVIATVGAGLSAGLSLPASCIVANLAASVVVAKVGTATATTAEVLHRWRELSPQLKATLEPYL